MAGYHRRTEEKTQHFSSGSRRVDTAYFGVENVEDVADKVGFAEKKLSFIESGIFNKYCTFCHLSLEMGCRVRSSFSDNECLADLDMSNYRIGFVLRCCVEL